MIVQFIDDHGCLAGGGGEEIEGVFAEGLGAWFFVDHLSSDREVSGVIDARSSSDVVMSVWLFGGGDVGI